MALRALVSCSWLQKAMTKTPTELKVLESSWSPQKVAAYESFLTEHIPTAKFFDMWQNVQVLPHIARPLPDLKAFEQQLEKAGVSDNNHLILYDKSTYKFPMFSARMYMQCKHIGLPSVSVLDGGFVHWKQLGYEVEAGDTAESECGKIDVTSSPRFEDIQTIVATARSGSRQIVDSRAPDYFRGENEEPSPATKGALKAAGLEAPAPGSMRAGHHVGAKNLFYETLRNPDTNCFKSTKELEELFADANVNPHEPTITTCYNALTACMVPLAATKCGASAEHFNVYIGSWTEFGQHGSEDDIVKGTAV